MAEFVVGEIAIICNCVRVAYFNNRECEITGGLKLRNGKTWKTPHMAYEINVGGEILYCRPQNLRKRKPPSDPWSEIERQTGWNPAKVSSGH